MRDLEAGIEAVPAPPPILGNRPDEVAEAVAVNVGVRRLI